MNIHSPHQQSLPVPNSCDLWVTTIVPFNLCLYEKGFIVFELVLKMAYLLVDLAVHLSDKSASYVCYVRVTKGCKGKVVWKTLAW